MAALIQRHAASNLADANFPPDLSPMLGRVFMARGARCSDDIDLSMSSLLSPSLLMGIDGAVDLIIAAMESDA